MVMGGNTTHCVSCKLPVTVRNLLPFLPTHTHLTHTAAEGIFHPHSCPTLPSPPNIIHRQERADETKRELEDEV